MVGSCKGRGSGGSQGCIGDGIDVGLGWREGTSDVVGDWDEFGENVE